MSAYYKIITGIVTWQKLFPMKKSFEKYGTEG